MSFPCLARQLVDLPDGRDAVPGSYWRVAPERQGRKEWGKYVHHSLRGPSIYWRVRNRYSRVHLHVCEGLRNNLPITT
jgi:hypothetical protein